MVLATGNAAKVYCLNWLEAAITARAPAPFTILDMGCGRAGAFVRLLSLYPQVSYVGIEPSAPACEAARQQLAGRNAVIHQGWAYDVAGRLVQEQFDAVISFSVLEHVVQRQRYVDSMRDCLKDDGHILINYDAGHFVAPATTRERLKNLIGPLLAAVGIERYYQRFVREDDFRQMVRSAGLHIVEDKFFNTRLKGVHKHIPAEYADEHMQRWLDYELWLNTLGIRYDDARARTWFSRNFILQKETPSP